MTNFLAYYLTSVAPGGISAGVVVVDSVVVVVAVDEVVVVLVIVLLVVVFLVDFVRIVLSLVVIVLNRMFESVKKLSSEHRTFRHNNPISKNLNILCLDQNIENK